MQVTNSTYNLGIATWEIGELERARRAFDETFERADAMGDVIHRTAANFMLAELDLVSGDLDEAERRLRACLPVYAELGSERSRAECFVVLGGIRAAAGDAEEAARLFGAAAVLRRGSPVNRFEAPVLDRYLPEMEAQLGTDRIASLFAEAAQLAPEAAIALVVPRGSGH